MSRVQFNILCPNGRRVNIKTEPLKPILLLIEEACSKQGFTPENYDLKHLRRILDPSTIIRYSNIPNNAQLELVESATPRKIASVSVTLATSSGSRFIHEFSSNVTLWQILHHHSTHFSSEEALIISEVSEPLVVYTIQKISGEKLKTTTLKSLGLLSGKCMLRYSIQKITTGAPSQPHVSSIIKPRKPIVNEETIDVIEPAEISASEQPGVASSVKSSNASQTVISSLRIFPKESEKLLTSSVRIEEPLNTIVPETSDVVNKSEIKCVEEKDVHMESEDEELGNSENSLIKLIPLCDGDTFLFSEDDIVSTRLSNEDDSFFELTVDEVKKMYKDLVNAKNELENAPLLTGRIREMEQNSVMLSTLNSYPITVLRIVFPDRYIIQSSFKPQNKVSDVINFLRQFLSNNLLDFYLYTLFPRKKLEIDSTLVAAGCTPKARVYFGIDDKQTQYLKDEILSKKSTFTAVSKEVSGKRKRIQELME